jgi:hypothetical protein
VRLVLAGIADRVAAKLGPKTAARLREAVEMGNGEDVARWLANELVNALDERIAHFTLPPDFKSEGRCERCGGVVVFGIDYLAPGCSAQWEKLPEQCVETAAGGRCGWIGRDGGAGDDAEAEDMPSC